MPKTRIFLLGLDFLSKEKGPLHITYHTTSVNGPLWYLRTLIVIFIFAPLFYEIACKRMPAWLICLIGVMGLLSDAKIPFLCVNIAHIAWFMLGIGIMKGHYLEMSTGFRISWVEILIALCWIAGAALRADVLPCGKWAWLCTEWGYNAVAFLGVLSVYCFAVKVKRLPSKLQFCSNTFWLYCCHFPICLWIKSIGRFLAKENDFGLLSVAILTPVLTLFSCLVLQKIVQRLSPVFFARLCGGR